MTDPIDFPGFVNNQQFQKSDPTLKKKYKDLVIERFQNNEYTSIDVQGLMVKQAHSCVTACPHSVSNNVKVLRKLKPSILKKLVKGWNFYRITYCIVTAD